ncbi:MAG: IPT/TIG domain-containing protein [Bryobacteraceae bacterium]
MRLTALALCLAAAAAAQTTPATIGSVIPSSGQLNTSVDIRVLGSNFLSGDLILFQRPGSTAPNQLSTVRVSATELRATVPGSLMNPAGSASIRVFFIRDSRECANGCQTSSVSFLINELLRLSSITPTTAPAGTTVNLAALGSGFNSSSLLVYIQGNIETALSTQVMSATELRATIPSNLTAPGEAQILVQNGVSCPGPCPRSNALPLLLSSNLLLTSVTPNQAPTRAATAPGQDILLAGGGFAMDARVVFRAGPSVNELPAKVVSDKEIMATIPATLLTAPGTAFVAVRNPGLEGALDVTSNELPFQIVQSLELTRLEPLSAPSGSPDTTVSVFGLGFNITTRIRIQAPGGPLLVPANQRFDQAAGRIDVPLVADLLRTPVRYTVTAFDTGNADRISSNSLVFEVTQGGPRITQLTPAARAAGSSAFTLVIAGSGFTAGSRVLFGTRELIPGNIIADRIEVLVPGDAIAAAGIVPVRVRPLQGLESNTVNFTVSAGALISSLNPSSRIAGSGAFALTILGSNFATGSSVLFGGRTIVPTSVSADTIAVSIPADAILTPGSIPVLIRSADGADSNAVNFTVTARAAISSLDPPSRPAGSGTFTLTILGSGFVSGSRVIFGARELLPVSLTADRITVSVPAGAITAAGPIAVRVRAGDGSETNSVQFTVADRPAITSLDPPNRPAGSGEFILTINGSGFAAGAVVFFGDRRLTPLSVSGAQIRVNVPADAVVVEGPLLVRVNSGGVDSNETGFTVTPPAALSLTSLNPASAVAGSSDFDLTIAGRNLLPSPRVTFAGTPVNLTGAATALSITVRVPGVLIAAAGPKPVEVTVAGRSSSLTFNVTAAVPPAAISAASLRVAPGGNTSVQVQLSSAATAAVNGELRLSFEPDATGIPSGFIDPAAMFTGSGSTALPFTIAAGQTDAALAGGGRINVGTVAGVLVVRVATLASAGQTVTVLPDPVRIEVPRAAPSLTDGSVRLTNTTGGVTVQVQGFAPSREMTNATIAFTIAAQTDVDGGTSFTAPLQAVFQSYFNSDEGRANGSRFELRIPFTVEGDANRITAVSVTLSNGDGQATLAGGR